MYLHVFLYLQVMNMNKNDTTPAETTAVSNVGLGLAVGLPLALIFVAAAITVFCIRRNRSTNISQPTEQKVTEDPVHNTANPRYIASVRPTATPHDPVYENFQSKGPGLAQNSDTPSTSTHRYVYLQSAVSIKIAE